MATIFLLTRPMRDVTWKFFENVGVLAISTHTPHARRDLVPCGMLVTDGHFYSHAPCEA